jgi:putative aldouronate transport system substrate-binding protein
MKYIFKEEKKVKMSIRKIMALVLALAMTLTMAACSSGSATSTAGDSTASSKTNDAAVSAAQQSAASTATSTGVLAGNTSVTASDILSRDYSKKVTISFAGVQCTDGLDYNEGNDYYKWWTEHFNVEWDVTPVTWDTWAEKMNTWINADDMPDWCVWNFNAGDGKNYANQNLVKKMSDTWKTDYPNLAAAASCSPDNAYYETLYGGQYYFFRPVFANNFPADTITSHISMYVRKDWAKKAGYDLSANEKSGTMSITEYLAYCKAIKDAGICEYPWYNTSSSVGQLIDSVSDAGGVMQSAYYVGSDGKYHWGPGEESSGVKAAVKQVKSAYDAGLLYPEFYTLQDPDDVGHFYSAGDSAAAIYSGMAAWFDRFNTSMTKDLGVDFYDTCDVFVMTDDKGVAHADASQNYWACNIISPNIDDEKLERLLDIWDYGCTEEGQLQIRLGIQGTDWDYDSNGKVKNLLADTGETLEQKYTSLYPITGNMFILSDDFSFVTPANSDKSKALVTSLYKTRASVTNSKDKSIDWNYASYSSQALNLATMTYATEYANIISMDGDFDTNYDNWVTSKMSLVQPVLDDLNAQFASSSTSSK